ncbi:MAG: PAS domain S-box protein [Nostocales cyanobacterium]|nr:MAG: PAS domain S-box protein [Nostocales cyanobacterium]
MAISHYSILILEDSPEDRVRYCRYLNQDQVATYDLIEAASGLEALSQLAQITPDLILVNYQLPDMDGLEFLNQLQSQIGEQQIPLIMLVEQGDEAIAVLAMKIGIHDYIIKSRLTCARLCRAVHTLLEKIQLIRQIRIQKKELEKSIGQEISNQAQIKKEYKEVIEALKALETKLLFYAMVDIILIMDKQGRYLKIASTNTDKLYRPAQELIGKTVHEVLPTHLADLCITIIQKTLAIQQPSECEYRLQIANKELWFSAKVSAISQETVIWAARDISAAKRNEIISQQAEQAFQESQILLQMVMDSLPMAIFWKDRNSRYLGCNRQLVLDAGLSSVAEIIGKTDFDLPWKEQAPLYRADDHIVIESGQPKFNIEEPFTKHDSLTRWLHTNKMPLYNPNGEIIGVLCSYEDITERKQISQALQASEQRYATLVTSAPVGIYRADAAGNCLYVNNQWCKTTGLTMEEARGWGWKKALHPQDRELVVAGWEHLVQTGQTFSLEYRFQHPDGVERWVFGQAVAEQNPEGKITGYIGTITDISLRKKAEWERDRLLQILEAQNHTLEAQVAQRTAELEQSKERFRNLVETSSDWVWEVNEFGIYTYASPQILHVLGYSPAEILGKTPFDLMPPLEAARILTEFRKFALAQTPFQCLENTNRHKDGRLIILETSAVPIFDENKKFRGYRGMDRDITARKQAEIAIRQNEARFQRIAANVPGVMYQYILHPDGSHKFVYISDRCREVYELEPSTILEDADSVFNLTHPEDLPSLHESIVRSASSLQQWSWEGRVITPSGHLKWIRGVSQPEQEANGDILWDGIILDISAQQAALLERQQIETALHKLSGRLNLAIKSAQIGIWDWDIINDHLVWDERMYELYGVKPSDFTAAYQAWETGIHPDDLLLSRAAIQQAIAGEIDFEPEFRVVWPDGTIKFIKAYAIIQRDDEGKAQRMIGLNYDISGSKLAQAEMIRSRDLREAIFNESADALFLVDSETVKTLDCNQRAVEMFAATNKNDLIGIEGHHLQKEQFTPEEIQKITNEMNTYGVWSREIEYKTFKGDSFWGSLAAKQITIADQKMNLVRVTDISQRKLTETQLQQTNKQLAAFNEELARATRLKDEFLANMSHELRTPLNVILGLSEGLQDNVFGMINDKQRRSLQTIENSGKHLLELINDILDLSKIEAGQMKLNYTQVAISPLCQSSLAFIKQQALQKQIRLEVKIQATLPELLLDERRIRQVLINLLNNAVKFTPEGGQITLEVTHQKLASETMITSGQSYIRIAVIDTGIGIALENLNKLFQPFIQIDSALNRQYTGTGLGLALVKRIVEIHGGKVGISSELGVGSCFTVDLPCGNISDAASESENQSSSDFDSILHEKAQESPLILLAEDNEANLFTISNYLVATGYRIIVAKNGQEAITLTKMQFPDLILMDIQMPGIDGLEAIRQIRLDLKLANIPIIALTALAMPGDQEKCLVAGANHYLQKPVRLKQLVKIIKQFLVAKIGLVKFLYPQQQD